MGNTCECTSTVAHFVRPIQSVGRKTRHPIQTIRGRACTFEFIQWSSIIKHAYVATLSYRFSTYVIIGTKLDRKRSPRGRKSSARFPQEYFTERVRNALEELSATYCRAHSDSAEHDRMRYLFLSAHRYSELLGNSPGQFHECHVVCRRWSRSVTGKQNFIGKNLRNFH